jgi:hypothetical protein
MRKHPDKPKSREILQNNWPALFKNTNILKDKEQLQNPFLIKETWQQLDWMLEQEEKMLF